MDLDLLHTFIEVSKTRHFGKAADNLYITQSAVSARIRSLEESLNTRLFERTTKQVNLTEEGEKFVKHAETILLAWATARLDVSTSVEDNELLSIGSTAGLWHYLFNDKLASIDREWSLLLNTMSYSTEDLTRLLFANALDLVLTYEKIDDLSIQFVPLGTMNLRLFMYADKISQFDATMTPYIHIDWGSGFNPFIAKHFNNKLPLVMQTDNAQTAQYLLIRMQAAAYLPEVVTEQQNDLLIINKKQAPVFKRKVYACYHSDSDKRHEIKKLVKHFQF